MTFTVQLGSDYRLKAGDGASGTEGFATVGGEGTLAINGTSKSIDASSKDDTNTDATAQGKSATSIDIAGVVKTPDPGLAAIDGAYKSRLPIDIEVVKASTVKYAASVFVGNRKLSLDNNDAVKYSYTLTLAGDPTVDSFIAAS
jgi:TP901-1 family phage major tail protein